MPEHIKQDFRCVYENIPCLDSDARHRGKHRITSVETKIVRRTTTNWRGAAPDPLVGSMKEYLSGVPALLQISMDNGHLIGLSLGGIDSKFNIAPMVGWFNEVQYRSLERSLSDDTSVKYVRVEVAYDDTHLAVPTSFRVLVKRATDAAPDPAANPYVLETMLAMRAGTPQPYPMDAGIREAVAAILPAVKPAAEPYAFLERLDLGLMAEASEFTERQRAYILTANALYANAAGGGGFFLRSDDPDDPIKTLNPQGGADRPQVDHVIPRSVGGANSFRNAMVLSKRQNGLKSAKIDEETMAILLAARDKRPTRSSKAFTKAEVGRAERKKSGFPY